MQIQAGQVHILRRDRRVEPGQYQPKLQRVRRLDTRFRSPQKEALKPLVFEASNHGNKCNVLRYACQSEAAT